MINIRDLSFSYDNQNEISFPDWSVYRKDHTLILGNSGSGKTTLLHLLGGLLRPTGGEVTIDNTSLASLSNTQLDHFRGKNIGFVFQQPHLIQSLNVEDNLFLAEYLAGLPRNRTRVNNVLERLNMLPKRKSKIFELSEGQKQRVVIGRAVMNKPKLLLADEPTSSLDDDHCFQVLDLLLEQADENDACLVIATHDQRLKDRFSNQIVLDS